MRAPRTVGVAVGGGLSALLAGCGWSSDTDEAKSKADAFTQAVLETELAPAMTAEVARSLYADDGGTVCALLDDDPQSPSLVAWARTNVRGQPEEQAQDVIEYDRIVVETYCPENLERFETLISDLNYEAPA